MEVRWVEDRDDEPRHTGKIGLWITSEYLIDAAVTLDQLIELRAAIDKFLFLRPALPMGAERG